jgi:hypothetical protein
MEIKIFVFSYTHDDETDNNEMYYLKNEFDPPCFTFNILLLLLGITTGASYVL